MRQISHNDRKRKSEREGERALHREFIILHRCGTHLNKRKSTDPSVEKGS